MEIAILVFLFLVGTVGGALQAMRFLDRRRERQAGKQESQKPADRNEP